MKPSSFQSAAGLKFLTAVTLLTAAVSLHAQENLSPGLTGFIENKGQIHDQSGNHNAAVKYLYCGDGLNVQLRASGFSYDTWIFNADPNKPTDPMAHKMGLAYNDQSTYSFHRVDVEFVGANSNPEIVAEGKSAEFYNYYTAGTPAEGVHDVHTFKRIVYLDLYPGIDLEFVTGGTSGKEVEYNFIVHPNADASLITMKYSGADRMTLNGGKIQISTSNGTLEEHIPVSFWKESGVNEDIRYTLIDYNDGSYGVKFNGKMESPTETLIIDPMPFVGWGTYFGGTAADIIHDINFEYFCGTTSSAANIATAGVEQSTIGGVADGFMGKIDGADGTLVFATYLGGTQNDEAFGLSISIQNSPGVYVTGITYSTTGIVEPLVTPYDGTNDGGGDAFICIYNSTNGQRSYGTYYGGAGLDQGNAIAASWFSGFPAVVIVGSTATNTGTTIASPASVHPMYGGGSSDGFIASIAVAGTTRNYGTYFGGTGTDVLADCAYANTMSSDVVFCGTIASSGLGIGASCDITFNGAADGMTGRIHPTTGNITWAGYSGGPGSDYFFTLDYEGSGTNGIRAGGMTTSTTGIHAFSGYQSVYGGGIFDGFIHTLSDANGVINQGTYYGGPGEDAVTGILTGPDATTYGNSWDMTFCGHTNSTSGVATAGSHDPTFNGGEDIFIAQIIGFSNQRVFGTYFGGSGIDNCNGIGRFDNGSYMVAGRTASNGGISTAGTHQLTFAGGSDDGFLARIDGCQGIGFPSGFTIAPIATTVCSGTSVTLTVSGGNLNGAHNYYWYTGGCGVTLIDSGAALTRTPLSTTTYYVSKESWNNCSQSTCESVTITVNPIPTVTATASNSTICFGSTTSLTGNGATIYTWMPGNLSGTTVIVAPASNTTYTVTGTTAGCSSTSTVSVAVIATPTVTTSTSNGVICSGGIASITANGASTYLWQPGNLTGSTVGVSPTNTTTYTVVGTAANGCTATATRTITVLTPPTVTVTPGSTICAGVSVSLSANGATTYVWNPGAMSGSGISVTPLVTTTYTVVGTNAAGCTGTATTTIIVNQLPTVSASTSANTICSGEDVVLTGSGAQSYSWEPINLTTNPVVDAPFITTTYTVYGTDANGCSNNATVTVTVNSTPTVTATGTPNTSACAGNQFNLSASGANTYLWTPGNYTGASASVILNATETFTLIGTETNGCADTITLVVNVLPLPSVVANASDTGVCPGLPVTLNGTGAMTYTWDNGVTDNVPFVPTNTATYIVIGQDANGCEASDTISISVGALPDTSATLLPDQITLSANQNGATYQWINCTTMTPIAGATNQSYTATANGNYAVIVNLNGCPDTSSCYLIQSVGLTENQSHTLNVYPNPVASTLTIEGVEVNSAIRIYNSLGEIVFSIITISDRIEIDFSALAPGIYSVHPGANSPILVVHTR